MAGEDENDFAGRSQMAAIVWLILAMVIGIVLYLSYYFANMGVKKKEKKPPVPGAGVAAPAVAGPAGRRRRMRVQRREEDDDNDRFDGFNDSDGTEDILDDVELPEGKIGAKKRKKLEMKAEKRAEREALAEEREEKKKQDALLAAEREKEAKRKDAEEAQLAEQELLQKEEKERQEHEEYLKLKEAFTIEESGEVGVLSEEESQALLQEFIDYVKAAKVIQLEDLALHFHLKTQEIIDRLQNLQEMGRLTGVMDDRGKFIYISEEELKNVAKFIKQRGRISIAELAESSNTLITLQEKENQDAKLVDVST